MFNVKLSRKAVLTDLDNSPDTSNDQLRLDFVSDVSYSMNKFQISKARGALALDIIAEGSDDQSYYIEAVIPKAKGKGEVEVFKKKFRTVMYPFGPIYIVVTPIVKVKAGAEFEAALNIPSFKVLRVRKKSNFSYQKINGVSSYSTSTPFYINPETYTPPVSVDFKLIPYIKFPIEFHFFDEGFSWGTQGDIIPEWKTGAGLKIEPFVQAELSAKTYLRDSLVMCANSKAGITLGGQFTFLGQRILEVEKSFSFFIKKDTCTGSLPSKVITQQVSNVSSTSAQVQGVIQNYKAGNVISYGICYSTTATVPTVNDNIVEFAAESNPPDSKTFMATLVNLITNKVYNVRAYAKTANGSVYGNTLSFSTTSTNPTVITQKVDNMSAISAQVQGIIQNYEVGNVVSYGVCYSITATQPTINNTKVEFTTEINPPDSFSD